MTQKERLLRLLSRFVREDDKAKDDRAFVRAVLERWEASLSEPIIDVGE